MAWYVLKTHDLVFECIGHADSLPNNLMAGIVQSTNDPTGGVECVSEIISNSFRNLSELGEANLWVLL